MEIIISSRPKFKLVCACSCLVYRKNIGYFLISLWYYAYYS